jgi:hypothetical protein
MPCATSQVSATLIGHSSSSGASIQSRISPKSERCSREVSCESAGSWLSIPDRRTPGPIGVPEPRQLAIFSRQ